jgi:hypothetical protein
MTQAYTPGLKVTERMVLHKSRTMPLKGDVLVKVGDKVKAEDIVAKTELPGGIHIINVMNILGCEAKEVPEYMLKKEGDQITEGEIIAETKPLLPFLKFMAAKVKSPINGSIERISSITGQVLLREPPLPVTIKAYIDGKISKVIPQEGVVVETICSFVQGIFGIGGETNGELLIAVSKPSDELNPDAITAAHAGKILVCGRYVDIEVFKRARTLGVKGLIAGGFGDKDLKELLGYDLGVAITGHENIGLTLVVTEGFGRIAMAQKTFSLLKEREGLRTSISGATQIRAGVIRPEIIIPLDAKAAAESVKPQAHAAGGVKEGDPVRIIREPNFGRLAKVKRLIPDLMVVESETKVRVMEVEFDDGTAFIVPRANIEIIED